MHEQIYPFILPSLSYPYDTLEPYIDEATMRVHHQGHMQGYIDSLNELLPRYTTNVEKTLDDILTSHWVKSVMNNAGGIYNHLLFFEQLSTGTSPNGEVLSAIVSEYGNVDEMLIELKKASMSVFGSGWAWLIHTERRGLTIYTTNNQDTIHSIPIFDGKVTPLIAIDVWEHAYYLKHKNRRSDYIDDLFKCINWNVVGQRYLNTMRGTTC